MGKIFPLTKKRLRKNQEYKKRDILNNSLSPPGKVCGAHIILNLCL